MRAYRGSRGLALFIFNLGRWMEESGQPHAPVFAPGKGLDGPLVGSGRLGEEKRVLPCCATQIYSPGTVVCSVSVPSNFMRTKLNSSPLSAVNTDIVMFFFLSSPLVTFPESEVTEPSAVLLTVCLTSKEFTGGLEISPTPRTHSLTYTVIVYHSNREVLLPRLSESTPATCTIHIVPGSQTFRERERERERETKREL